MKLDVIGWGPFRLLGERDRWSRAKKKMRDTMLAIRSAETISEGKHNAH